MKNIYEILKEFGLEVPAEKKATLKRHGKKTIVPKQSTIMAVTKRDAIILLIP